MALEAHSVLDQLPHFGRRLPKLDSFEKGFYGEAVPRAGGSALTFRRAFSTILDVPLGVPSGLHPGQRVGREFGRPIFPRIQAGDVRQITSAERAQMRLFVPGGTSHPAGLAYCS